MSMMKLAGVMALSAFTVMGAFACSSSDSGSPTDGGTGGSCTGSGSGTGSSACTSCAQSKCGSQYGACFGSGGKCAAYVAAGCKGTPDGECIGCIGTLTSCQSEACSTECKSTGSDAGTDTSVAKPNPTNPNCKTLVACCDSSKFPAAAKSSCYSLAGFDDDANCKSGYDGFKGAGYCE